MKTQTRVFYLKGKKVHTIQYNCIQCYTLVVSSVI